MPRNLFSLKITLPDAASSPKPDHIPRNIDNKRSINTLSPPKQYSPVDAINETARCYHAVQSQVEDDWHPSILTERNIATWDFAYGPRASKCAVKRNNELIQPNINEVGDASKLAGNDTAVEDFANSKESSSSREPKAEADDIKELDTESVRNKGTNRATIKTSLRRWSSGCSKPKPAEKPFENSPQIVSEKPLISSGLENPQNLMK
jgi:hypothetical protein